MVPLFYPFQMAHFGLEDNPSLQSLEKSQNAYFPFQQCKLAIFLVIPSWIRVVKLKMVHFHLEIAYGYGDIDNSVHF